MECVTAQVGAGANLVLFTTGLGTPTGNPVAPVIKISTNSALAGRMGDIIDFDAGAIVTGATTIADCAEKLLELSIEVASGERLTKAEVLGQNDFIPWKRGVSLLEPLSQDQFQQLATHFRLRFGAGLIRPNSADSPFMRWVVSRIHSRHDAATDSAAMAAVSARRMRGPSETARHPLASKSASSSGAHPPSGPIGDFESGHLVPGRGNGFFQRGAQGGGAFLLGKHDARCAGCGSDARRRAARDRG